MVQFLSNQIVNLSLSKADYNGNAGFDKLSLTVFFKMRSICDFSDPLQMQTKTHTQHRCAHHVYPLRDG